MRSIKAFILILSLGLISCENDAQQQLEADKIVQKNEAVFKNISKMWQFHFPEPSAEIKANLNAWNEWRQFEIEMRQKPKSSLSAFRLKTKNIAIKADTLVITAPIDYQKPQVLSRLTTLNTKIKSLEIFMNLQVIPEARIAKLIPEINEEIKGLYNQWEEIIVKRAIPKEIGEELMLQALDTTRNARPKQMKEKMQISDQIKDE
jgi:ribosomal protein S18